MSTQQRQRPDFFEGQYLGAADLDLAVDYARFQMSRHALGSHTWGIVSGLQLEEVESVDGSSVNVFVQPGLAVDAFGRQIVVNEARELGKSNFAGFTDKPPAGKPGLDVFVWIRYVGTPFGSPKSGFESCDPEQGTTKIQDEFEFVFSTRDDLEQDPVIVSGIEIDPIQVVPNRLEDEPLWCDGSLPQQTFPASDEDRLWLVPLGRVRWDPDNQVLLPTGEEALRLAHRGFRRYAGAVAEEILAADGLVRVRRRESAPPEDVTEPLHAACEALAVNDQVDGGDLVWDEPTGRVRAVDLMWVEGNLRVVGDAKLFGGQLDLRTGEGDQDDAPLYVRRVENNGLHEVRGDDTTDQGKDLQLVIGKDTKGIHRLVVGPHQEPTEAEPHGPLIDHLVVMDNGRVGVGASDPEHTLQVGDGTAAVVAALRGPDDDPESSRFAFQGAGGSGAGWIEAVHDTQARQLNIRSAEMTEPIMSIGRADGRVGLGTTTPNSQLHLAGDDPDITLDLNSASAVANWAELRFSIDHSIKGKLYLSKLDNKLRVENQGQTSMVFDTDKVGIGTDAPAAALHIHGTHGADDADLAGGGLLVVGDIGERNMVLDNNEIQARDNGAASILGVQSDGGDFHIHHNQSTDREIVFKDSGDVGIGTASPTEKLDVRGNIRLSDSGTPLYAPGCLQNMQIISGAVDSGGNEAGGTGFTSVPNGTGAYIVTFNPPFSSPPIVVVSPFAHEDNVLRVHSTSNGSAHIRSFDVSGGNDGDQNAGFTFVAIGPR